MPLSLLYVLYWEYPMMLKLNYRNKKKPIAKKKKKKKYKIMLLNLNV